MDEALLPPPVLARATLRGNEYAWPFAHVAEAISAAQAAGLATLGGQAQFRLPDGFDREGFEHRVEARHNPRRLSLNSFALAAQLAGAEEVGFDLWFAWYDAFAATRQP